MQGNTQDLCALPNKSSPRANIEIAIKLPVYNRQHWHLDHIGHRHDDAHHRPKVSQVSTAAELTHWDFTALGDLSTWFQYEIWQRDKTNAISHLQLGLGITLSTGSTTIQNTLTISLPNPHYNQVVAPLALLSQQPAAIRSLYQL